MRRFILLVISAVVTLPALAHEKPAIDDVKNLVDNIFNLSDVMLHDVANPPVASRFYAYALLGAYGVTLAGNDNPQDITLHFKEKPGIKLPELFPHFSRTFCAMYTMLEIGKRMMPSGYRLEEDQEALIKQYRKFYKWSDEALTLNKAFSLQVANQVLDYVSNDGYTNLSTFTRYTPSNKEGGWYPTPPAYMAPVEPNWNTIRTFFLDSASQFTPAPPVPFSAEKDSKFFEIAREVYDITGRLTPEQKEIAAFWDCNPFALKYSGHLEIGLKKLSPGAHWMNITGIVCQQSKVSFEKAVFAHTLVALTLHDAFVSCWDEKYRSDRIRPETAINKMIDKDWRPLLQTPPFPEYTSGHSVISSASAEVLTFLFGDNYHYIDTSEEYFGLKPRNFNSFREACNEAAISRLYGGIHYMDAINDGQKQGMLIGQFIIRTISKGIP